MDTGSKTVDVTFTPIFEASHDTHGQLVVCIRGKHDLAVPNFNPLNYDFEVARWDRPQGRWVLLEDEVVGRELVALATTYWYMLRGEILTSDAQPTKEISAGTEVWRIDLPEYGVTIVEHCAVVKYDGDHFQILVAHPGPRVYLTVILEILSVEPMEWLGIRLDEALVDGIIDTYLREIGAIASDEAEGDADAAGDDPDLSVC